MNAPWFVELGDGFELSLMRHFSDSEAPSGHPPSAGTFVAVDLERVVETFMHRWPWN